MKSKNQSNLTRGNKETKIIISSLHQIQKGQEVTHKDLQRGFIGLARQNTILQNLNEELKNQLKDVQKELKTAVKELNFMKKEREKKVAVKEAWANRKRLPKRQPVTPKIYKLIMEAAEGPGYIAARNRIAFCILTVTGIRINELLPLRVYQLETLRNDHWIGIDRSKRGPANHKAFLTQEGKKLVKEREKDFQLLFLMKDSNSYVFTSEKDHNQMLRRESITKDINKIMHFVSKGLPEKPYITSHSFRVGYISQLWKDTKDIEFVKQAIGHQTLDATSSYVEKLSDKERQNRISKIKGPY